MEIIFLGHSAFHIKGKSASLVSDPFDPQMVGIRFPKVSANIVTISHDHKDHNKAELVADVKKVISGPGEYEVEGISVIGLGSYHDNKKGEERGKNTIYVYEVDGLRLAHLGDLGHELSEGDINNIGTIDILMIPVGGIYTIGPKEAAEVSRSIEPRIIIPMHYGMPGLNPASFGNLVDEKPFISAMGLPSRVEKKLSIKADQMPEDSQEIVVLAVV